MNTAMNHHHLHTSEENTNTFKLAFSATLHCLIGCGLGEVAGMVIGTMLNMSNHSTMILAIILGFVGGFGIGVIPLKKQGTLGRLHLNRFLLLKD